MPYLIRFAAATTGWALAGVHRLKETTGYL
jgi:hypothetical protein